MNNTNKIDIKFSDKAASQYHLIKENDFTLENKEMRLLIDSKGCDGFTYALGFTELREDDETIIINSNLDKKIIKLIIDPFTLFYCKKIIIDYMQDFKSDNEGFMVINHNEYLFHGKFFKNDDNLVPGHLEK